MMNDQLPCVRCGVNPRYGEVFVCQPCRNDKRFRGEIRSAEEAAIDHMTQRQWLIEHGGWVGGWSIRRGAIRQ